MSINCKGVFPQEHLGDKWGEKKPVQALELCDVSFDNHRAEAIPEHRGQQESCNTCQPPSWTDADRDERVALRVRSSTYQSETAALSG